MIKEHCEMQKTKMSCNNKPEYSPLPPINYLKPNHNWILNKYKIDGDKCRCQIGE